MPSGRKGKSKQRSKRKIHKQLLERSRRSRDDQINSALEETDVITHIPGSGSLHRLSLCQSQLSDTLFDSTDNTFYTFSTLNCTSSSHLNPLGLPCFVNSTPKKNIIVLPSGLAKTRRSLSTPSSLYLSPITSQSEDELGNILDSSMSSHILSMDNASWQISWLRFIKKTQDLFSNIPYFFSKLYTWVEGIIITVKLAKFSCNNDSNLTLKIEKEDEKEKETLEQATQVKSNTREDEIFTKLSEILTAVTRLDEKHDLLMSRVDGLEKCMKNLKLQPQAMALPPPPPPPPPPPCPLMSTPVARAATRPAKLAPNKDTPRPSISLQDILNVQLKKTPSVKPVERTPQCNVPRGPVVSVDMLRSVKLRPSQLRRRSIERPRQSPSAVFKIRSP